MKKIRKRPMELGVLSRFAEDDSNPFDVIARYGRRHNPALQLGHGKMDKRKREKSQT